VDALRGRRPTITFIARASSFTLPTQDCGSDIRAGEPFIAEAGATVDFDRTVGAHWNAHVPPSLAATILRDFGVTGSVTGLVSLEGHTTERMTAGCALDIAEAGVSIGCTTTCGVGRLPA
jgi:hypothetical protein